MDLLDGDDDGVVLRLSCDEALVLNEWIHRNENIGLDLATAGVIDLAERGVLWELSGCLERSLSAPFRPDYPKLLDQARARLRSPSDGR